MIDTTKLLQEFSLLTRQQKQEKVKKILRLLSAKSVFFGDFANFYLPKSSIQENALDAMYHFVVHLADVQQQQ